jgi:signal transduction histidine kinase
VPCRLPACRFRVCRADDFQICLPADAGAAVPGYLPSVLTSFERRKLGHWPFDAALAVGVACAGLAEVLANGAIEPRSAALPCEVGLGLALLGRRRYPLATVALVAVLATIEAVAGVPVDAPWVPLAAYMIATYSLVSRASSERVGIGVALVVLAVAVQVVSQHKGFGNFVFAVIFIAPIYLAGRTIRSRTERAEELERDQDERARAAAEQERRRIARELHDVISHSLGVLVLQAGAAEQVLERDPAKAREVLESIRKTGQEAIAELATLLAVARGEIESSREPQPSLADLEQLTETMRQAGLNVEVEVEGIRRELPAAVGLSAYRIVQEGLTNVLKHAGHASARVVVRYTDRELEIEISDDGTGGPAGPGGRRGLAGVSERVAVFGGRFDAGPAPGRGWTMRAALPLTQ